MLEAVLKPSKTIRLILATFLSSLVLAAYIFEYIVLNKGTETSEITIYSFIILVLTYIIYFIKIK